MRKFIVAAVLLLLLANAVVLAGVAYNRSGAPLASIELTERELPIHRSFGIADENTATTLSIRWNSLDADADPMRTFSTHRSPSWLDDEKLVELGFDIDERERHGDGSRSRLSSVVTEAILVLEYAGEAYRKALGLAESRATELRKEVSDNPEDENLANRYRNFSERLGRFKQSRTRLYIVDAGLDTPSLRTKYAGKGAYLFMRGEVSVRRTEDGIDARIRGLSIPQVHTPLPFSRMLSDLTDDGSKRPYETMAGPPRYMVRLSIGKRLESWVESVAVLANDESRGESRVGQAHGID